MIGRARDGLEGSEPGPVTQALTELINAASREMLNKMSMPGIWARTVTSAFGRPLACRTISATPSLVKSSSVSYRPWAMRIVNGRGWSRYAIDAVRPGSAGLRSASTIAVIVVNSGAGPSTSIPKNCRISLVPPSAATR
jgi:hypothetical protein